MFTERQQRLDYVARTLTHSPLYSTFYASMCSQNDREILALLALINPDQPPQVLFFSAVNALLFRDHEHELATFYPALSPTPRPAEDAYPAFRDFCLAHRGELERLLPGARLQTNEVTRCANLLPAFALVFQRGGNKPLACLEIGCSAGLNLNWDQYQYCYYGSSALFVGNATSPVQISCRIGEGIHPLLPHAIPMVAQRTGIELFPLNLNCEKDRYWLRGCIWPEEVFRYRLLDAAIAMAQQYPPEVRAGDASHMLPQFLQEDHTEQTICVYHSFALNQGPALIREQVIQTLVEFSRQQTIYRLSLEAPLQGTHPPQLEVFTYRDGALVDQEWIATCVIHGEQMSRKDKNYV